MKKIKVIVILGPTSSGKSDAAICLAKKIKGEIISTDSRQIYKDMTLGTGKVEGFWEDKAYKFKYKTHSKIFEHRHRGFFISESVPHYLLDFVSPKENYNISHFKKDCELLIKEISAKGKIPILCGGTGFWISAVVEGKILPQVTPDTKLRKKLNNLETKKVFEKLKKLDPQRAKKIDPNNKIRLIRAIEICQALGKVPKLKKEPSKQFDFLQIGIDHPIEILEEKIKKRLDGRWQSGMTQEINFIKEKHNLSWEEIQSFGLAYYWIPLYLQDQIDKNELRKRVYFAERNYAKRQKTWFKKQKNITWENDSKKILKIAQEFLN